MNYTYKLITETDRLWDFFLVEQREVFRWMCLKSDQQKVQFFCLVPKLLNIFLVWLNIKHDFFLWTSCYFFWKSANYFFLGVGWMAPHPFSRRFFHGNHRVTPPPPPAQSQVLLSTFALHRRCLVEGSTPPSWRFSCCLGGWLVILGDWYRSDTPTWWKQRLTSII